MTRQKKIKSKLRIIKVENDMGVHYEVQQSWRLFWKVNWLNYQHATGFNTEGNNVYQNDKYPTYEDALVFFNKEALRLFPIITDVTPTDLGPHNNYTID